MKLKNKVVLITGGSTGIGKSIAKAFLEKGAKVIIFGMNKPDYDATFYNVDVSKESEIKNAFKKIKEIDVFVNNAGICIPKKILETTTEIMNKIIDINLKGVFLMCKNAIPKMNANGCIINISSLAGLKSFEEFGIYSATKAAVISLSKTLSIELAENKIRANAIAPGIIDTEIWGKMYGEKANSLLNDFKKSVLLKRAGKPEEIAHTALFLAENDFINGAVISVDGGEGI